MADLTLYQNSDYTIQITVYEDEAETTVRDITGYLTPRLRIGHLHLDTTILQVNGSITDAVNGLVDFPITAANLAPANFDPADYALQAEISDASSNAQVITDIVVEIKESLPDSP